MWQCLLTTLSIATIAALLPHCKPNTTPADHQSSAVTLKKFTYQQGLMGTRFVITLYHDNQSQADAAALEAFQFAAKVNDACSDYDVTSELMQLNAAPENQAFPLGPILYDVLSSSVMLARETNGAYDPTLGHHSYNWRMARKKKTLPSLEKISTAKAASGWQHIILDHANKTCTKLVANMRLDLGGIAKGYAADGMLRTLNKYQISRASITAGGEVRLGDPPPQQSGWTISLNTLDTNHQLSPQSLTLANCGISTSGDLHQSVTINGKHYSHIVNPITGLGLTTRISATVIGPNSTLTDALATALCVNPNFDTKRAQTLVIMADPDMALKAISNTLWQAR